MTPLKKYRIIYENGVVQEKYLIPSNIDFFTQKSPIGEAMKTGLLVLPKDQGGTTKIKIEEIT